MEMYKRSTILQFQTTQFLNSAECKNLYETGDLKRYGYVAGKVKDIDQEFICTTNEQGKGMCLGDTGNPLVFQESMGNQTLVGLSSWYVECSSDHPNVYTKVYSHLDWIRAEMNL